jgi:hypothetical protein
MTVVLQVQKASYTPEISPRKKGSKLSECYPHKTRGLAAADFPNCQPSFLPLARPRPMEVQTQTVEVPARPSHAVVQVCVGLPPPKELPKRETIVHYYDMVLCTSHVIEYSPALELPRELPKSRKKYKQ